MTLFDLALLFVICLFLIIIISGAGLFILLIDHLKKRHKNKARFNEEHPVGTLFTTRVEQKMPYGKWKLQGKDQNGFYLYERTK